MATSRARQLTVTREHGKIGLRVRALNSGVFVCLVADGLPAARSGLHFGDQILQIDGQDMTGLSTPQVHDIFRDKEDGQSFDLIVRDRPFERTVNLIRDGSGHIGFQFRGGQIINIVKHSSAAQNGLLTEHNLLEINGKNVIGLRDSEVTQIIGQFQEKAINVTIMPSFLFGLMVEEMDPSLFQKMDHSSPSLLYSKLVRGITSPEGFLGTIGTRF